MKRSSLWSVCTLLAACVAAGAAVILSGCGGGGTKQRECTIPIDSRLVSANSDFSFDLFKEIIREDAGRNVFISPTSVSLVLSMTYNGAAGETQKAMASALGIDGLSLQEANEANAALIANLRGPGPGVTLKVANSLWAEKNLSFKPDFMQRNTDYYAAEVTSLDFADPAATKTINNWARDHTQGKIPTLFDSPLDPATTLVLVNAIYFKGSWTKTFDKNLTREMPFKLPDGSSKPVQMMRQTANFSYLKEEGFQAISLPYGSGRVSMYIFLPDESSSLNEFYTKLNAESWDRWMAKFQETMELEVLVMTPKFKLEYGTKLNEALTALGMGAAFDPARADFSGMSPTAMWIDMVVHKTFVEVNEEGTEAAAASAASFVTGGVPSFIVDRPFFFAIRDNKTGEILFMGSIMDPT